MEEDGSTLLTLISAANHEATTHATYETFEEVIYAALPTYTDSWEQLVVSPTLPSSLSSLPKPLRKSLRANPPRAWKRLPIALSSLTTLRVLVLAHNEFPLLPPDIGLLTSLLFLDISHTKLAQIPPAALASCSSLQTLRASHNALRSPPDLRALHSLRSLDLSHNKLSSLDSELVFLPQNNALTELDLSHNPRLDSFPLPVFRGTLGNLTSLNLSSTAISWLSPGICLRLRRLTSLALIDTRIVHLPPQFDALVALTRVAILNFTLTADSGLDVEGSLHHFFRLCGQTSLPLFLNAFADLILAHDPNTYDVVRAGAGPLFLNLITKGNPEHVEAAIHALPKLLITEHSKAELLTAGLVEALDILLESEPSIETIELVLASLVRLSLYSTTYVKILFAEHSGTTFLHKILSSPSYPDPVRGFAQDALTALATQIPSVGMLQIRVLEAMQLIDPTTGKPPSSPYAIIRIGNEKTTTEAAKKASAGAPVWSRSSQLNVGVADAVGRIFSVMVYNRRTLRKDTLLGTARLPVLSYVDGILVDNWFKLRPPESRIAASVSSTSSMSGYIHLQIHFSPQASSYFAGMAQSSRVWSLPPEVLRRLSSSSDGGGGGGGGGDGDGDGGEEDRPMPPTVSLALSSGSSSGLSAGSCAGRVEDTRESTRYESFFTALSSDLRLYEIVTLGLDASSSVYFDNDPDGFFHRSAFSRVQWSNRHSEQKYLMATRPHGSSRGTDLYVSYMGTYSMADALIDFNVFSSSVLGGRVHTGFATRARSIPLLPLLQFLRPPAHAHGHGSSSDPSSESEPNRLVLCGHSLGGAVAVLVFLRLITECSLTPEEIDRIYVVTAGSPLIGDEDLSEYVRSLGVDSRIYNIVNEGDSATSFSSASARTIASNLVQHAKEATRDKLRELAAQRREADPGADVSNEEEALESLINSPTSIAIDVLTEYILRQAPQVFCDFRPFGRFFVISHAGSRTNKAAYEGSDIEVIVTRSPSLVKEMLEMPEGGLSTFNLDQHKLYFYFQNWCLLEAREPAHEPLPFPRETLSEYQERFGGFGTDPGVTPNPNADVGLDTDDPVSWVEVDAVVVDMSTADLSVDIASSEIEGGGSGGVVGGGVVGGGGGGGGGEELKVGKMFTPSVEASHAVFDARTASIEVILFGKRLLGVTRLKFRGEDYSYEPVFLTDNELRFRLRWLPAVYGTVDVGEEESGARAGPDETGGVGEGEVEEGVVDGVGEDDGEVGFAATVKLGSYESLTLRVISHFGEARVKLDLSEHARNMSRVARVVRKFWEEDQERSVRAEKLLAGMPESVTGGLSSGPWRTPGAVFGLTWQGLTNALASVASTLEHTNLVESLARGYLTSGAFQEYLAESGDVQLQFSHFAVSSIKFPPPRVAMDARRNKVNVALAGIEIELEAAFSFVRLTQRFSYSNVGVTVSLKGMGGSLELNVVETADEVHERAAALSRREGEEEDDELLTDDLVAVMIPPAALGLSIGTMDVDFGFEYENERGEVLATKENWGYAAFVLSQFSGYIKTSIRKALDVGPLESALISELTRVFLEGKPGTHVPIPSVGAVVTADYSLVPSPSLKQEAASSMLVTGHRGMVRTFAPGALVEHYDAIPEPRGMDGPLSMCDLHDAVVAVSPSLVASAVVAGWHAEVFGVGFGLGELPGSVPVEDLFAAWLGGGEGGVEGKRVKVEVTGPPRVRFEEGVGVRMEFDVDFVLVGGGGGGEEGEKELVVQKVVLDVVWDSRSFVLGEGGLEGVSVKVKHEGLEEGMGPVAEFVGTFREEVNDFLVLTYSSRLVDLVRDWVRSSPLILLDSVQRVAREAEAHVTTFSDALVVSFVIPEYVLDEREVELVVRAAGDAWGWDQGARKNPPGHDGGVDDVFESQGGGGGLGGGYDSFADWLGAFLEEWILVHRHPQASADAGAGADADDAQASGADADAGGEDAEEEDVEEEDA